MTAPTTCWLHPRPSTPLLLTPTTTKTSSTRRRNEHEKCCSPTRLERARLAARGAAYGRGRASDLCSHIAPKGTIAGDFSNFMPTYPLPTTAPASRRQQGEAAITDPNAECAIYSWPPVAAAVTGGQFPPIWEPVTEVPANDTEGRAKFLAINGRAIAGDFSNFTPTYPLTDPDCWWTFHQCVTPKVAGLNPDIASVPEPRSLVCGFDDGPNCSHNAFYDYLSERGQAATMFYIGSNVLDWSLARSRTAIRFVFCAGFRRASARFFVLFRLRALFLVLRASRRVGFSKNPRFSCPSARGVASPSCFRCAFALRTFFHQTWMWMGSWMSGRCGEDVDVGVDRDGDGMEMLRAGSRRWGCRGDGYEMGSMLVYARYSLSMLAGSRRWRWRWDGDVELDVNVEPARASTSTRLGPTRLYATGPRSRGRASQLHSAGLGLMMLGVLGAGCVCWVCWTDSSVGVVLQRAAAWSGAGRGTHDAAERDSTQFGPMRAVGRCCDIANPSKRRVQPARS
ncbi:hypothetical protein C8R45DRAFT_1081539 [Mycena sanguinolenta]|nr:hypothetical protein C8R45DRAFT_1081539 [Mycena sanguinolenta]